MELGLSLGETSTSRQPFGSSSSNKKSQSQSLGFCMSLGLGNEQDNGGETSKRKDVDVDDDEEERRVGSGSSSSSAGDPPLVQLDLLPSAPVLTRNNNPPSSQLGFPWSSENAGNSDGGSSGQMGVSARGFDVNLLPSTEEIDDGAAVSSPNSTVSSFQIDFSIYKGSGSGSKRDSEAAGFNEVEAERTSSRASDDDENGLTRKKLRLSKDQSAFLEESFKEHNTLNPKQKLALAKQLNLRPRQVEVWFQNRRARTKLKQTEVDCEYLKRCCETLTEENRRLQKELQELRALKTSHPYYMQLPATTLTMCPSCERVATTTNSNNTTTTANPNTTNKADTTTTAPKNTTTSNNNNNNKVVTAFPLNKPRFYPFSHAHQSAAT